MSETRRNRLLAKAFVAYQIGIGLAVSALCVYGSVALFPAGLVLLAFVPLLTKLEIDYWRARD